MSQKTIYGDRDQNSEEKSIAETLRPYTERWIWFVVGLALFLSLGLLYMRYVSPRYKTSAKVLIRDESRGSLAPEMQVFGDLGIIPQTSNIDNELEILRSRTLMDKVIDSLSLYISYFSEGRIKNSHIYHETPVSLSIEDYNGGSAQWRINLSETGRLVVADKETDQKWEVIAGEVFETPVGRARITLTNGTSDYPVLIKIEPYRELERISFANATKFSGIVDISIVSDNPSKDVDMLNTLIAMYNNSSISEKRWMIEQTINFIEDRLTHISQELELVEKDVEDYKKTHRLTDLQSEAGIYLSSGSEYEKRLIDISTQKEIISSIGDYVGNVNNLHNLIPADLSITDASLISLIERYNELQHTRRSAVVSMTPDNPLLIEMDNQLLSLRNDILVGIKNLEASYNLTLRNLERQGNSYSARIRNLSTTEREFHDYLRKKEITETIFLYLLQKREESAISLSMMTPNARIIDPALTDYNKAFPNRMIVLAIAFLFGLLLPAILIYIIELFNLKIKTRGDVEKLTTAPILGETPEVRGKPELVIEDDDISNVAEQYRLLTTNLEFLLGHDEKVVMVTSSLPNEGKSSFTLNMALAWATTGKKVVLVDLDMRNTRLNDFIDGQKNKREKRGISSYLVDASVKAWDIIVHSELSPNLDVVHAGINPPNPIQLLKSDRLESFFSYLRSHYDIVLIDTPPVMPVADPLIISRVSDATVYVTRVGLTCKSHLKTPEQLFHNGKFKNLSYVIKGTHTGQAYGYGYGYGYGNEKEKNRFLYDLLRFWKKK